MLKDTITLLLFIFPLAWSPGPGNMFFAANSARFGLKKTIAANLGYHIATFFVIIFMGIGLSFTANPIFLDIIKYAGSAYILFLAYKLANFTPSLNSQSSHIKFSDGVILLLLNPKAYVIFGIILGQFLPSADNNSLFTTLWIASVFTANNLFSFIIWSLLGERLSHLLLKDKNTKFINYLFALMLAIVAIWLFFG